MKIFFYITGLALAGLVFADPKPVSWLELAETVRPSTSGESAPQIAAAGEGTFPGETLILTGDGLEDATLIIRTADREVALAPLHSASDRMLAVLPDALPRAALVVWPVRGGQVGAPIRVNAPQVWWHWPLRVTTQTDKLHLMGRNFKLPDGGTAVYMEGGGFEGIVPVTESDPYHLCVRLPGGLTAGDCQLYVWNGTDWGWSDPLTVSIEAEQAAPSAATLIAGDYGAHPNDDTDDAAALQAALDALAPGGTLVLARGRYLLSRSLVVTTPNVSIKGAGAGAYDAAAVTINGAATHLKYADVYQLPASLIEICAAGCEVSALAAENGNNGEDQTVISVHAPDARIHDVTLVSHDKRNWGYAEPGPNFGTPKNNPNPLTTKVVDSGALFVETVGRADLWFYDSAVHAVGPGVLIGTLQAVSTSLNPAPCAPSSDGVRVEGVRFTGYYAGEPNNQPNTGGSGRAVGVIIYNGKKLAVRNCQFESAARTARKIMCRTVLALNTSTRDLYLAENRSLNVGSHTSATGMDPNQGESYLFHYHYPYGGLFNVAQAGPDSVTPVLSGIPPVPGQPGDPHYNDPHYFTDNAGSRVLPEVGANDHWLVFICAGKGVGQYRQVTAQTDEGGLIKLTLDRPWRVVPDTASRFNLTPAYRQIVLYKNYVDTGGSTNLRNQHKANGVLFWFYAFDNVVEGNTFKATTSGILFNSRFRSPTAWNLTRGNTVSDVMGRSQDTTAVSPAGYVDHVRITQGWPAPEDRVFYSVGNAARENYFDVGNGAATKYYGVGAYLHAVFTGNVNAGLPPVEHATGGIVMSVIENNVFTGLLEEGVSVETPANTCLVRRNQIKLPNETPAEKAVVVAPEISGLNMVVENNEAVPEITRSPLSQSAPLGTRIKLTVSAAGGDNFQYQWMKDGAILDGA
ncbi:MAG: immunoglobulin domain-containing protein, partial [Opitutaceae bacterium]|nr:immunoglobulin domain-containing protein [Opitutaceae bacterium]